jgi:hypothetical protein
VSCPSATSKSSRQGDFGATVIGFNPLRPMGSDTVKRDLWRWEKVDLVGVAPLLAGAQVTV